MEYPGQGMLTTRPWPTDHHTTSSAAAAPVFASLPCTFGRYRVLRRLGKGGMGAVYLAHDTTLDRQVALKVSHFHAEEEATVAARFLREARAAAGIQHESVCPIFDYGECNGIHYITMAYISGRPLSSLLQAEQPLDQRWVAGLVCKVALALQVAHRLRVLHRDLKPSNIMLDERDQPKVVDFGLAWRPQDPLLTQPGTTMGTLSYMSPEQVECRPLDAGTDIFSLGVILYQLLTGRLPFPGPVSSAYPYHIVHTPAEAPSHHRPDLDPRLETICLKALAKAVPDRHATMEELAGELQGYLDSAVLAPKEVLAGARQGSLQPTRTSVGKPNKWVLRARRWRLAGALPVVLWALVGLSYCTYILMPPKPASLIIYTGEASVEPKISTSTDTEHVRLPAARKDMSALAIRDRSGNRRESIRNSDLSVLVASTAGLVGSPGGQGAVLAASALFPGRAKFSAHFSHAYAIDSPSLLKEP
jgi:serine/threonine protein kinase